MKEYKSVQITGDFSFPNGLKDLQKYIEPLRKHNEIVSINVQFARGGIPYDIVTIKYATEVKSPCSYIGTSTSSTINANCGYAKNIFSTPTNNK